LAAKSALIFLLKRFLISSLACGDLAQVSPDGEEPPAGGGVIFFIAKKVTKKGDPRRDRLRAAGHRFAPTSRLYSA